MNEWVVATWSSRPFLMALQPRMPQLSCDRDRGVGEGTHIAVALFEKGENNERMTSCCFPFVFAKVIKGIIASAVSFSSDNLFPEKMGLKSTFIFRESIGPNFS